MRRAGASGPRLVVTAMALALGFVLASAALAAPKLELVSRTSGGTPADGNSYTPVPQGLSADGRVAVFQSLSPNLPGGDSGHVQAYVRTAAGKTKLVSKAPNGDPSGSDVQVQGISANGRFVTFQSNGAGLPGANGDPQVWVYDLARGKLSIASRANNGEAGSDDSFDSALSASGRWVAFVSRSDNLPHGDGSNARVYVRDRKRRRTILVSKTNGGEPALGSLYGQVISSDGRRVTFYSNDEALPGGDGIADHVYVRDLDKGRTRLVDRNNKGKVANASGYNASISGNGRFVVFESGATNLPGQTGHQIYVRDMKRNRTLLAGRNNQGEPQDGSVEFAQLSGDGRIVEFTSDAENLPGGSVGNHSLVYARNMRTGKVRLASKTAGGDVASSESTQGSISLDGRWILFDSSADNLGGNSLYTNIFRVRLGL